MENWTCSDCRKHNKTRYQEKKCKFCNSIRVTVISHHEAMKIFSSHIDALMEMKGDLGQKTYRDVLITFKDRIQDLINKGKNSTYMTMSHEDPFIVKLLSSSPGAIALCYFLGYDQDFDALRYDSEPIESYLQDVLLAIKEQIDNPTIGGKSIFRLISCIL